MNSGSRIDLDEQAKPSRVFTKPRHFLGFWWNVSMTALLRLRRRDIRFVGLRLTEHVYLGVVYDDPIFDNPQTPGGENDAACSINA